MRAAIFLGFMYLADSVGANELSDGAQIVASCAFFVFMAMDVLEFFKKLSD